MRQNQGQQIPTPRLAALAVVTDGAGGEAGRVLLVRRRNPPDQGLWGYPGGKVDYGERVADAAIRELAEETGIQAEPLCQLSALDIIGPVTEGAAEAGPAWHFFLVPVLCRYLGGVPQAADDAEEAAWFPFSEILTRAHPMSADVDAVLREALARLPATVHATGKAEAL